VDTTRRSIYSVKNIETEAAVTAKTRYIRLKALGLKLFLLLNLLHQTRSTKIEAVLTTKPVHQKTKHRTESVLGAQTC
jgi:hypothetical protein